MNIHEYQAKGILRDFGIDIPVGYPVLNENEISSQIAKLTGPIWVVKSQIHAGGRGKGRFVESSAGDQGGVRVCKSQKDAIDNARSMLGNTLVTHQSGPAGKQVSRLYIEDGSTISKEFYLSMLVDRTTSQIAFIASTEGGMDIEEVAEKNPDKITTIQINPSTGVKPFHGRQLAIALALTGKQVKQATELMTKLYQIFTEKDCSLIEINPLIINNNDDLLCLDCKMNFDSNALYRHRDIFAMRDETEEDPKELQASKFDLNYIALDGDIGCMVNGAGLAMATMDIIKLYGHAPANFLDVGGGATTEKVTEAFKIITSDLNVKGILVNIFGGIMRCDVIAQGVISAVRDVGLNVPLVVRLEGTNVEQGKKIITDSDLNVIAADNLADAAQKIVTAVKEAA